MEFQRLKWSQTDCWIYTVLVVDDDAATCELLSDWLRTLGYSAVVACDADSALRIMRKRHVDVAFCDICMPGRDGIWLIDQIRTHFPDTAVVIATGLTKMDPAVTLGPRVAAYIVKPFELESVKTAVEQALTLLQPTRQPMRTPGALPSAADPWRIGREH